MSYYLNSLQIRSHLELDSIGIFIFIVLETRTNSLYVRRIIVKYDFLVVGAGLYGAVFAQQAKENVSFGGRIGEYKYYDMDTTVLQALKLSNQLLG